MPGLPLEPSMLVIVLLGALAAGLTTGFAGFGTGLVASDLWFHPLPASMVPPLAALASVAAQSIGIITVRKAFNWNKAQPFLLGGLIGVPLGIAALVAASPFWIWTAIATFLIAYAAYQLVGDPSAVSEAGAADAQTARLASPAGSSAALLVCQDSCRSSGSTCVEAILIPSAPSTSRSMSSS